MKRSIILLLIQLFFFGYVYCLDYFGEFDITVSQNQNNIFNDTINIDLNSNALKINPTIKVLFRWRVYVFMGEPVIYSEAVCLFEPGILNYSVYNLSESLYNKIRVYGLQIRSFLNEKNSKKLISGNNSAQYASVIFDPGVLLKPYFGTKEQFLKLTKEEQKKFWSLNVPGSPSWDKTFLSTDLLFYADHNFVNAKYAKDIMKRGFTFQEGYGTSRSRVLSLSIDYSVIEKWYIEQEKELFENNKKELIKQEKEVVSISEKERLLEKIKVIENDIDVLTDKYNDIINTKKYVDELIIEKKNNINKEIITNNRNNETSILFLIDISGSMSGDKLLSAKSAAKKSIEKLISRKSEVAIMAFSGECHSPIKKSISFTTDVSALNKFIDSLGASGGTPLSAALIEANQFLAKYSNAPSTNKMILLLADGANSCGNLNEGLTQLKKNGFFFRHETIGLGIEPFSEASTQLQNIANMSGGQYHYSEDHAQLGEIFTSALDNMLLLDLIGAFSNKNNEKKQNRYFEDSYTNNANINNNTSLWGILDDE